MLGDVLREARLTAGLTQEAVATRAKLSREYVNQVENNHRDPTVAVLLRICRAIGTRASDVVAKVEEEAA